MTCSAKTPPACSISQPPGVAETATESGRIASHSSKRKRTVVHAGGQAEAVFGQRRLAPEVAAIHAADLRDGDVALVDEDQRVVGDVFEQRRRRIARLAAGEVARIVLDAGAGAGRLQHLQVEAGALLQPLGLQQSSSLFKLLQPVLQLFLDRLDGLIQASGAA